MDTEFKFENSVEMDGGDGYTAMWLHLMAVT